MSLFQFILFLFLISLSKAIYDGFTYRSWTYIVVKKRKTYGFLKHSFGILFIIIVSFVFGIYGKYYDIFNIKADIILLFAFACFNFTWFNLLYSFFSGEKNQFSNTSIVDISVISFFKGIEKIYKSITKKEPEFSFLPILWFMKLISFGLGCWLIDQFISI